MAGSLLTSLLQICFWVCRWQSFENRTIFDEITRKIWCLPFYGSQCRNVRSDL